MRATAGFWPRKCNTEKSDPMKSFLTSTLAGAAALSAGSTALADEAASRAVWERHVQAATAGDIDAVMADFTEESAIITTDGVISGTADIRRFFEDLLGGLAAGALETTVSNAEFTHGNVLVANFTIGAVGRTFQDTAVIRDDRFLVLTTVNYAAE
jgi:ketosteroid isomerase-like protein